MKRCLSLLLIIAILLSGCSAAANPERTSEDQPQQDTGNTDPGEVSEPETPDVHPEQNEDSAPGTEQENEYQPEIPDFRGLEDPNLHRYAKDLIYKELVETLNDDGYFVEDISAVYVSQEYLDELEFNSQSNIFFGYTLEELDEQFQGTRYVFTLDENGETDVQPFEEYENPYNQVLKNVAIGSGAILICVTVSVVSAGVGAPAMTMIFATAAKTGTIFALSSGAIGGISAGIIKGIETGDFDEALKAGALAGSESFKWGAITGIISGAAGEAVALKGTTLNGLTMNEAATIQMESGYPLDVIKGFKSMEQYQICKDAGLKTVMVNGKESLVRAIDLDYVDELGRTNLERMRLGYAALDPETGLPYQLHHIGQKADSTLAILTRAEHMQGGNDLIWHDKDIDSLVHGPMFDSAWTKQRQDFWKSLAELLANGGI